MASTNLTISCVSIIGPDDSLLFIRKYPVDSYNFEIDSIVFCSLDYISQDKRTSKKERFIGQLQMPDQKYNVWGYKTALGYKIIILTNPIPNPSESTIKSISEKIKDVLFVQFTNPFYKPFSPINSVNFTNKINQIVSNYLSTE